MFIMLNEIEAFKTSDRAFFVEPNEMCTCLKGIRVQRTQQIEFYCRKIATIFQMMNEEKI